MSSLSETARCVSASIVNPGPREFMVLFAMFITLAPAIAQETSGVTDRSNQDQSAEEQQLQADSADSSASVDTRKRSPIASRLPDGRPLRPIGIYESQMDVVIPSHYRPISLKRFNEAITRLTGQATGDQAGRLKGSVYWVHLDDGTLVSNRSEIDIESDQKGVVRRSLGKVNLAIEPQDRGANLLNEALPRLESEANDNLVAVFRGDDALQTAVRFQWRLRGKVLGSGHEFVMRIPRTPQTRIVMSIPSTHEIEIFDGVLRTQPNPPPDADVKDPDLRWYEIDAGGLSTIRIRTRQIQTASQEKSFIIRESSVQYQAEPSGMKWESRMVVQLPHDQHFPVLTIRGTVITSVRVNGTEVPFTRKTLGGQEQHLQIEMPHGIVSDQAVSVTVIVTGYTRWKGQNGWCELPMPRWMGEQVVHASAVDDIQLAVLEPLKVMSWELPSDWTSRQLQPLEEDETLYTASGPPIPLSAIGDGDPGTNTVRNWSRVRLIHQPSLESGQTALDLKVVGGALQASARVAVKVDPSRIEPLRMRVEPGWSLESLSFAGSGRIIEHAKVKAGSREFTLWPEAEDVSESEIVIEAKGSKILSSTSGGLVISPTWFLRALGVRSSFVAAITPPADLNWSGDAALQDGRVEISDLTASERAVFSGLEQDALCFRTELGRTPRVVLETPSVAFSAATLFKIQRERGQSEVTEELHVEIESIGQSLRELSIQTGPSAGRPPFQWYISGSQNSPSTTVPSSDVIVGEGDTDGTYTIDVSDKNFRQQQLIARRRYPVRPQQEVQLPSIPGAASQSSEVLVGSGLLVRSKSRSVQLIPLSRAKWIDETDQGSAVDPGKIVSSTRPADEAGSEFVRLRYDAVEQPSILLTKTDVNPNATIVWRERILVVASSRGSDMIEATYRVSMATPLEIEYAPELQLVTVSRNNIPVDVSERHQRPTDISHGNRRLVLQPEAKTETIRVQWNRSQFGSNWIRQCRIPRISVSGTVLNSECQILSSSDTFAPASLLRGQVTDQRSYTALMMRPGEDVTLVRRNIALAIGWLVSFILFAGSWYVAQRAPLVVASIVIVLAAVVIMWWPWKIAVIGWLVVPVVAAGMLATSRAWREGGSQLDAPQDPNDDSGSKRIEDLSGEFSLESLARAMVLLLIVPTCLVFAMNAAIAQDSSMQTAVVASPAKAVNVLIPVDKNGDLAGPVVYVPRSVEEQLFQTDTSRRPLDPRFQSASYRVKIDSAVRGSNPLTGMSVEAEYLIHVEDGDRTSTQLRLPLAFSAVRRIELVDEGIGLLLFEESSGQLIATLPKGGNSFRLRVTLIPEVSDSEQWTKLFLRVPPVASSRLTVESEQSLDALRVGGTKGALLEETDLRRWVANVGPVDSLEIDFRTLAVANASVAKPLQRRYWVNAGRGQVTIDCEVDSPTVAAAGETFQFFVRAESNSEMPILTSANWSLDSVEQRSPTRRLIRVTSTRDSPGPVRLLWTQPSMLNFVDESVPLPITIPEVSASTGGGNAPAWIALHCDSTLSFAPMVRDNTEPLSVDVFLAAWSGYRGRNIDRAYVELDEIQSPILQTQPDNQKVASQRHDLHITPDQLELHYTAMLTPNASESQRYTLRLPRSLELISVSVNETTVDSRPVRSRGYNEVLLGSFDGAEPVAIHAIAIQRLPGNRRFSPPRLAIWPLDSTSDLYTISRGRSVTLRTITPPSIEQLESNQLNVADSLMRGWIPVSVWPIEASDDSDDLGTFEAKVRQTRFDARQLITLNRDDTRWSMETLIQFGSKRIPDFIDVEIPTRWCDSLEVSPATAWTSQPATDPSRQIIRVRCLADELSDKTLTIGGYLESSEAVRVNVPTVRVLGAGQRRTHINVPDQLVNEPIQWRTSAVEAVPLPDQWRSAIGQRELRSTYVAANPSWSIDLAPLPDVDVDPIAVNCDLQVFEKEDGLLAVCHWDLIPGSLEMVDVRMPRGAECVGVWTAGRAVVPEALSDGSIGGSRVQAGSPEQQTLRVPLSLSRLSQTVELLIKVPSSEAMRGNYLPELVDVPVGRIWLCEYARDDTRVRSWRAPPLAADRAIALARAVLESVESVDRVAERPREEFAKWFEPWLARYESIAASMGHIADFDAETATMDSDWQILDARMSPYVERFASRRIDPVSRRTTSDRVAPATTPSGPTYREAFIFGMSGFDGFRQKSITKLTVADRPPSIQSVATNDQALRKLMVSLLSLIMVGGVLVSLRPLRRYAIPVVVHPAFWLALMGFCGFAVAPLPVAIALLLVALVLPTFPNWRSVSTKSAA